MPLESVFSRFRKTGHRREKPSKSSRPPLSNAAGEVWLVGLTAQDVHVKGPIIITVLLNFVILC